LTHHVRLWQGKDRYCFDHTVHESVRAEVLGFRNAESDEGEESENKKPGRKPGRPKPTRRVEAKKAATVKPTKAKDSEAADR